MSCRAVQELLPEYVAGRRVPNRERVAGHLSRCESCDSARREIEAVFALLKETSAAPESMYGEANTRLALQCEFGAGPLRSERESRRREDALFRICATASMMSTVALAACGVFLWKTPAVANRLADLLGIKSSGIGGWVQSGILFDPLGTGVAALVLLMGGTAAILPALMRPRRGAGAGRRERREV